jgi:hypothetical protein
MCRSNMSVKLDYSTPFFECKFRAARMTGCLVLSCCNDEYSTRKTSRDLDLDPSGLGWRPSFQSHVWSDKVVEKWGAGKSELPLCRDYGSLSNQDPPYLSLTWWPCWTACRASWTLVVRDVSPLLFLISYSSAKAVFASIPDIGRQLIRFVTQTGDPVL